MPTAAVKVRAILACAVALTVVVGLRAQTQYEVVHTFSGSLAFPEGSLAQASDPNDDRFYGVALAGGDFDSGAIFRLTLGEEPTAIASLTPDMGVPVFGGGLLQASDGAFYFMTENGGSGEDGAIFRVTPAGDLSIWASFDFSEHGATPSGRLIEGSDGYLYGTALFGPEGAPGVVFRVNQAWGSTGEAGIIEPFAVFTREADDSAPAGAFPSAGVTEAPDGSFYGTAEMGGANGYGTLFRTTEGAVSAVHSFNNTDGSMPASPLLLASDGNLYGTATGGGDAADDVNLGAGTLFQFKLDGSTDPFVRLESFDSAFHGEFPYQQGVIEAGGYLFGTNSVGGALNWGTVYRWSTGTGFEVIRDLDGETDGFPNATLMAAKDGHLYGTGLAPAGGVMFRLMNEEVPASLAVAPATATYGGSTTLSATLSRSGAPIADAEIMFSLNGMGVGSAMTGADGIATLAGVSVDGINVGSYPGAIEASFAGGAGVQPVTAVGDLTIARATPTIDVDDATHVYDGLPHPATGTVTGVDGESLGPLTFTYNGGAAAPVDPGVYAVVASFAGNLNYEPASATAVITIIAPPPGLDGLVAAWGFDEGTGPIAGDASGKGHAGVIKQAGWTTYGRFGGALDFDGRNDWVTVEDTADLDIRNAITLEAWVKPRDLAGWNTILLKESGSGLAYSLYANDFYPRHPAGYVNVGGNDISVVDNTGLAFNAWSHVAMTYDGAMMRLYINGEAVGHRALTGRIIATNGALRIGGNDVWGEYFDGLIDEVRIYTRALSQAEVARDMKTPIVRDGVRPSVAIDSPSNGAALSGIPIVTVSANDNLALSSVQLQVDGVAVGEPLANAPFAFSLDLANGTYVLRAVARDVAGNMTVSAPVTIKIASAPVADYRFNESSGSVVSDASGNNNNGSITGGVTRTTDATRGKVLSFNGSNGLVSVADAAALDLTTAMTLEAWVRPTSVDGWRTVVLKEGDGLSYALYANDGDASRPAGYVRIDDRDKSIRGRNKLKTNTWVHLAMTYDGDTMRLFVNGEEVESRKQTGAAEVSNGKLRIGGNQVWGEWFKGQIDDVRIYDVAVGAAQIKADMNR